MQETRVQSLGWKDTLEEEMVAHSSIFAWGIPWTEDPGGLQSVGSQRFKHDIFKHMARHYARGLAVVWVPGVSLAYR